MDGWPRSSSFRRCSPDTSYLIHLSRCIQFVEVFFPRLSYLCWFSEYSAVLSINRPYSPVACVCVILLIPSYTAIVLLLALLFSTSLHIPLMNSSLSSLSLFFDPFGCVVSPCM